MSLLKSKFNLAILEVPEEFEITEGDVYRSLCKFKFKELSPSQDFGHGWVNPEDMFKDFILEDIVAANNIVGGYRYDKKNVPAPLLKKLFKEKLEQSQREEGRKLDKIEKKILKEECKAQLAMKVLPSPKLVTWIYNAEKNRIYLDTKSVSVVDSFRMLFNATFDVNLTLINFGLLSDKQEDFLNFLWKNTDDFETAWIDNGVTLNDNKNVFKFSGPTLEQHFDEIKSFKKTKSIKNLNMGLAIGDMDYSVTLNNKNFIMAIEGASGIKHECVETAVLDNVDRIDSIISQIDGMVKQYMA
jgi:hypothetical protein